MNDLRNYINLLESADAKVAETVVAESEDALLEFSTDDMMDDTGLEGTLDPRGLAKLLPEVDDVNRFVTAVRKIQQGDIPAITIAETRQLAKAFISLLKDDSADTMKIMQKLRMVHTKDAPVV